ncbi:MAG TPA: VIT family protein, partial [Candidatus Acidoferrum sp.]|nr:VIT family protein [Candidatus Acidoferrum sp.]
MVSSSQPTPWQQHQQRHKSHRAAWLRAAVLGADDGIVSTASLMIGVAAAHASETAILTAGIAGTIAGALSMAAGEYVSVSSQRDSERADIDLEAEALQQFAKEELQELEQIYLNRGLSPDLAHQVAKQLHSHDALAAHARDELGIHEKLANPLQAAVSSALSFAGGAVLPLISALFVATAYEVWVIAGVALLSLGILGIAGAVIGGGNKLRAALRVLIGGGLAMVITAL